MTKKKSKAANIIMIVIIAALVAAVILIAGYVRGWFGSKKDSGAVLENVKGIVEMTRNGVIYPVDQDTALRADDLVVCTPGGSASVRIGNGSALAIAERAELYILDASSDSFKAEIRNGELFAFTVNQKEPVTLATPYGEVEAKDAIVSLSVHTSSQSLKVFYGNVLDASAGEDISWSQDERQVIPISPESLNAFAIVQLHGANTLAQTCFTDEELDEVTAKREDEKNARTQEAMTEELQELNLEYTCTLTVFCSTILDNYDKLEPEKQEFVPEDGVILTTVSVPFAEGETAFDATKRALDAYGIQMEYSWTPVYNAYYVEGINHIYEFDCGAESGWMYKVNGWFPNYGASQYALQDGDAITWEYTCVGLGADIGGYAG